MAALLKQEVKGTVQRKDVLAMYQCTAAPASPARKCTLLQAFPLLCIFKVTWRGYGKTRSDVSSWKFLPETSLQKSRLVLQLCPLRDKKLLYPGAMMSSLGETLKTQVACWCYFYDRFFCQNKSWSGQNHYLLTFCAILTLRKMTQNCIFCFDRTVSLTWLISTDECNRRLISISVICDVLSVILHWLKSTKCLQNPESIFLQLSTEVIHETKCG